MAYEDGPSGVKRKALHGLVRQPVKARRLLDLGGASSDGIHHTRSKEAAWTALFAESDENKVFPGARPLAGCLVSEAGTQVPNADQDLLQTFVPGAGFQVPISWKYILKKICETVGLDVLDHGVHMDEDGKFYAWIEMEVPGLPVYPSKRIHKVFGNETEFRSDAVEIACKAAVAFLRHECGITVKDANYERVSDLERRASRAEFYMNYFQDMLAQKQRNEGALKQIYMTAMNRVKDACLNYMVAVEAADANDDDAEFGNFALAPHNLREYYGHVLVTAINEAMGAISDGVHRLI